MRKNMICWVMALIAMAQVAKAENVTIDDFSIVPGETAVVTLNLENSRNDLTAFEITLTLPEGLTLDVDNCTLTERFAGMLVVGTPDDNVYKLCGMAADLGVISGTEGALINLTVTADESFRGGVATLTDGYFIAVERDRVELDDSQVEVKAELLPGSLIGDANNDGVVNISDVVVTTNYVLGQTPAEFVFLNADVNMDGTITVADVVGIINIVLGN